MAGLDPAIHGLLRGTKNVDARDKPGHDDLRFRSPDERSDIRDDRSRISLRSCGLRDAHRRSTAIVRFANVSRSAMTDTK
ncbi:hypothetical protein CVM73_34435 [Bradyrhizobium forestalis]|uniref:Uncharacterized protein n=1 Tax=Bradyrhizobium forestalis TaxID=1419263 RepID=A0A2M8QZ28_9BRAD|nr:hypothetical protein CVM73_34435 [Bradyrhizobium forestalis]